MTEPQHIKPSLSLRISTWRALSVAILCACLTLPKSSIAALRVVATLPDFAALAEEIGGQHVQVQSLARGTEDVHFVDAKPSFIRLLNQAHILLEGGLELESGWLPPLLTQSRNAKIQPGAPGSVDMSQNIPLLDVHAGHADRSQGDVHPGGNPHYWLDPAHVLTMSRTVLEAFKKNDPEHGADYESNASRLNQRLQAKIQEWDRVMAPLKGTRVITYHRGFDYFLKRYGLELTGTLEPKPGIEPTPPHLKNLIQQNSIQPVRWILLEPFRPTKTAEYVAKPIHAQTIILPDKVGALPTATNSIALFDLLTTRLAKAQPVSAPVSK